jgi:hypothetical protein
VICCELTEPAFHVAAITGGLITLKIQPITLERNDLERVPLLCLSGQHSRVAVHHGSEYVRRMRHLPRPHSRYFRTVLVLAALAWVMLASGAMAAPLPMVMTATTVASHASASDCEGMPMAHTSARQNPTPTAPMGSGNCCQGGCHCLSACNAALVVPRLVLVETFSHASVPTIATVDPIQAPIAPPLRPPIV